MQSPAVANLGVRSAGGFVSNGLEENGTGSRIGRRALIATFMAAASLGVVFGLAAAGLGGSGGLGGLLKFREDGPGVATMGLVILGLFAASVTTTCSALASGGRQRPLTVAANASVKLALLVAVAFMFAFPGLSQFENKSLTLRAVAYPIFAFGLFTLFRLRRMHGPYPTLIDLCWSFTFTFDIVSNDLHWYGTWKHWDDFVHFLNSLPFIVLIVVTLLALERGGGMRLGFWGAALVGLAFYVSAHALWEMYEFSMDRFAGTNLQPGGMEEATRNNVAGIAGALLGTSLLWWWRRVGSLQKSAVEPLASCFSQLRSRGRDAVCASLKFSLTPCLAGCSVPVDQAPRPLMAQALGREVAGCSGLTRDRALEGGTRR